MGIPQSPPLLVVADSNVPLDLARGIDDVVDAIALVRLRLRGDRILIPPRVVRELAYFAVEATEVDVRTAASRFLRNHRQWGCQLVPDVPVGNEYVESVARELRVQGLLPESEVNDSVILVEAAALRASLLLTTDEHLRSVDYLRLKFFLDRVELTAPVIATPREIVSKFLR